MPTGKIADSREKTMLVFGVIVRIPEQGTVDAAWPSVSLDDELFAFAVGYLGRAESWTTCEALAEWPEAASCGPVDEGYSGDSIRLLAPLSPEAYRSERTRLIERARERIRAGMRNST